MKATQAKLEASRKVNEALAKQQKEDKKAYDSYEEDNKKATTLPTIARVAIR